MIDMSPTTVAKSDQLNADDLIGGPWTVKVTRVALTSEKEQPVAVYFDGDEGKPYKPGKSMRRVMVHLWGPDATAYAGRSMTLYRDEKVQFGGLVVGGIRISHMSHIEREEALALTATKGVKKAFVVKPLSARTKAQDLADRMIAAFDACAAGQEVMETIQRGRVPLEKLSAASPAEAARVEAARDAAYQRHVTPPKTQDPETDGEAASRALGEMAAVAGEAG